jgi:branched-chain amino acid transport system ATP-binding protein
MLALSAVEAAYDTSQVLFGVDLEVHAGEAVALLGRNGMGKTTTLRAIMGIVPVRAGEIRFEGRALSALPPYAIARAGLGLVPEGRQIFPNLSVAENLMVAAPRGRRASQSWTLERVFELFPRLRERRGNMGNQLSGGEQQMLAIGRALMTNPKLLILDEATEGLAPMIRSEIWSVLRRLKSLHQAILVVDKHVDALTRIADRHYILEKGRIAWHGTSAELMQNHDVQSQYLGV